MSASNSFSLVHNVHTKNSLDLNQETYIMRNFISNADLKLLQFLLADERVLVRRVVNENAPEYEPNGSKNAEQVEGGRPSVCREK